MGDDAKLSPIWERGRRLKVVTHWGKGGDVAKLSSIGERGRRRKVVIHWGRGATSQSCHPLGKGGGDVAKLSFIGTEGAVAKLSSIGEGGTSQSCHLLGKGGAVAELSFIRERGRRHYASALSFVGHINSTQCQFVLF